MCSQKDKDDEKCLQQLQEKVDEVYSSYDEKLKKAKKRNDRNKINELLALRSENCSEYEFDIKIIKDRQLLKKAEKYCVQAPPIADREKYDIEYHYRVLTEEAVIELRKAIREEEREEEKLRWQKWSILISLLIGLGGIIVAIISLLLK